MIKALAAAALLIGVTQTVNAGDLDMLKHHGHGKPPMIAPEIDPASAIAGLTLLVGGIAVLRGRRHI